MSRGLSLIGVPTNSAGKKDGVAGAPAALRRAGLLKALGRFYEIHDEGDVEFSAPATRRDPNSGIIAPDSLASMIRGVRAGVSRALQEGRFPLVIGGDCPVLLGCLAASAEAYSPTGLLFVDGHEDAYPARLSPTGEAADMELGFALGLEAPEPVRRVVSLPLVDPSLVCMLGPRDKKILQKTNLRSLDGMVEYYDDAAVRKDVEGLAGRAMRRLAPSTKGLWLHIDLDVLSTRSLPAVDYQQPGGISWGQLERLGKEAMRLGNIVGCNVTIYNPDMDPGGRFAGRIVKCLEKILAPA